MNSEAHTVAKKGWNVCPNLNQYQQFLQWGQHRVNVAYRNVQNLSLPPPSLSLSFSLSLSLSLLSHFAISPLHLLHYSQPK